LWGHTKLGRIAPEYFPRDYGLALQSSPYLFEKQTVLGKISSDVVTKEVKTSLSKDRDAE